MSSSTPVPTPTRPAAVAAAGSPGARFLVDRTVRTPYGVCKVVSCARVEAEGVYELESAGDSPWRLADGKSPKLYLREEDLGFREGEEVLTPYGRGLVRRDRWNLMRRSEAGGRGAEDAGVGDDAVEILAEWKLANKEPAVFYMRRQDVCMARSKELWRMNFEEKTERARTIKTEATNLYKNEQFQPAWRKYQESLNCLRNIPEMMDAEERAAVLELHISLSNNISTCAYKCERFHDMLPPAKAALEIVDRLLEHGEASVVYRTLVRRNNGSNDQLIKWKTKSLWLMAKYYEHTEEYDLVIAAAEVGVMLSADSKGQPFAGILKRAKDARRRMKKKQKKFWGNAFSKNSAEGRGSPGPSNSDDDDDAGGAMSPTSLRRSRSKGKKKGSKSTDGAIVKAGGGWLPWIMGTASVLGVIGLAGFLFMRYRRRNTFRRFA